MIISNNVRADIELYPDTLQKQFWNFVSDCTSLAAEWTDRTYGRIEIYHIINAPLNKPDCGS